MWILLYFQFTHLADQVRYMLDVGDLSSLTIVQACCPRFVPLHAIFHLMTLQVILKTFL